MKLKDHGMKDFFLWKGISWRFDYNTRTSSHNVDFYPTNGVPLFAECYDTLNQNVANKFYDYMQVIKWIWLFLQSFMTA